MDEKPASLSDIVKESLIISAVSYPLISTLVAYTKDEPLLEKLTDYKIIISSVIIGALYFGVSYINKKNQEKEQSDV